jgi:hypothetical protein
VISKVNIEKLNLVKLLHAKFFLPSGMYFLIYRSETTTVPLEEELGLILTHARNRNKTMDITGMLLSFDRKFLQLLEGEEKNVKKVYESICKDDRHINIKLLKDGHIDKRLFPGWSMSFRPVTRQEIADEPAYKDIYKPGSEGAIEVVSLFNLLRGKGK